MKSPSKTDLLIECLEKEGVLKVSNKFACNINAEKSHDVTDAVQEKKEFSILQLKSFKNQNRVHDHKKLVDEMVSFYGSINKAAKDLKINYCTLYKLCQPLKKKIHKKVEQKKINQRHLKDFFSLKSTTTCFPKARIADNRYMTSTYREAYKGYKKWCDENNIPRVSGKTFHRLKPKKVYKLADIPDNECICLLCQNFQKDKKCIEEYSIQGIAKHTSEIMLQSMCPVTDATGGVSKEYGRYSCISRNCETCGFKKIGQRKIRSDFFEKQIRKANPRIYSDKRIIKWQRWESFSRISKDGKEIKKIDKVDKYGTRKEFLQTFLKDVHDMALHMFNWKWHDHQFDFLKSTLKPGMLAQVLDFAQNYMNIHVDEPQGCHWDHTQTVIHPIVNFRICPKDGGLITEEHIMITDDLDHDKFAVKKFEDISLEELKKNGFDPSCVIQFCDNCSRQYKSKGPFQYISTSGIPTMRSYFGANHGKGPSDSATGNVKKTLALGRKSRRYELRTAFEVYTYLKTIFAERQKVKEEIASSRGTCVHHKQKAFFVTDIDRSDPIVAVTTKTSKKFSTIRSTGNDFIVEARQVACMCGSCMFGDATGCPNIHYTGEWVQYDLRTGKICKEKSSTHWDNCNIVQRSEEIISAENDQEVCHNTSSVVNTQNSCESVSYTSSPGSDDTILYNILDINDLFRNAQACTNFDSLKNLFQQNPITQFTGEPAKLNRSHRLDTIAHRNFPSDGPAGYLPVSIFGDGNCLPRALCVALGLNPNDFHQEMRLRICYEGVLNMSRYHDNSYLSLGAEHTYDRTTFAIVYADMSEYRMSYGCQAGESQCERITRWGDAAKKTYEEEVYMSRKSGEWMGMWQLFQAANCIQRPICSVYPDYLQDRIRRDLNRTIMPYDERFREREPIFIMWTPSTLQTCRPNHFVPLLKCTLKITIV